MIRKFAPSFFVMLRGTRKNLVVEKKLRDDEVCARRDLLAQIAPVGVLPALHAMWPSGKPALPMLNSRSLLEKRPARARTRRPPSSFEIAAIRRIAAEREQLRMPSFARFATTARSCSFVEFTHVRASSRAACDPVLALDADHEPSVSLAPCFRGTVRTGNSRGGRPSSAGMVPFQKTPLALVGLRLEKTRTKWRAASRPGTARGCRGLSSMGRGCAGSGPVAAIFNIRHHR